MIVGPFGSDEDHLVSSPSEFRSEHQPEKKEKTSRAADVTYDYPYEQVLSRYAINYSHLELPNSGFTLAY